MRARAPKLPPQTSHHPNSGTQAKARAHTTEGERAAGEMSDGAAYGSPHPRSSPLLPYPTTILANIVHLDIALSNSIKIGQ